MISRRMLILSSCCCGLTSDTHAAAIDESVSCVLYNAETANGRKPLSGLAPWTFREDYENGMIQILTELSDLLEVKAPFGYYDDDARNPNALATDAKYFPGTPAMNPQDGTVLLGRNFIQLLRNQTTYFTAALSAVCAHEYGHILQLKYIRDEFIGFTKPKVRIELHADYVCGYFGAFRRREERRYPAVMQATTQFRFGDRGYTAVSHGTQWQRGDAVYEGFKLGRQGRFGAKTVSAKGLEYVAGLQL